MYTRLGVAKRLDRKSAWGVRIPSPLSGLAQGAAAASGVLRRPRNPPEKQARRDPPALWSLPWGQSLFGDRLCPRCGRMPRRRLWRGQDVRGHSRRSRRGQRREAAEEPTRNPPRRGFVSRGGGRLELRGRLEFRGTGRFEGWVFQRRHADDGRRPEVARRRLTTHSKQRGAENSVIQTDSA